jgi:hypothetical protein
VCLHRNNKKKKEIILWCRVTGKKQRLNFVKKIKWEGSDGRWDGISCEHKKKEKKAER